MIFFDYLNKVETTLKPIEKDYWLNYHKWPADEILNVITEDHLVDLGSGCGLFGLYALYTNKVNSVTLVEGDKLKMDYARKLANELGIASRVTFIEEFAEPGHPDIMGQTVVSIRMGNLVNFERFFIHNRLITLRRTAEVEPYFIRRQNLPWKQSLIKRDDGFELELLEHDFTWLEDVLTKERWMEDLNPVLLELTKVKETQNIGNDK